MLRAAVLLTLSNILMTIASRGHLRHVHFAARRVERVAWRVASFRSSGRVCAAARRSMAATPALCLAAALAFTSGCAGDDGWAGTVHTLPGGARLVENPAAGLWREDDAWQVREELRIGASDGDGPDVFSVVFAFDVDDTGNFYAFDALARELRVFGPDGTLRRQFGRKGGGPGEFEGVIGVRVAGDGGVWLVDMQNARYTVLRADSVALHPRPSGMYRPPWIGGFSGDDTFHDIAAIRDGEIFVRVSGDGQVRDSVRLPYPELNVPRRGSMTFELPFAPRHLRAFDEAGYVWTATSHEYRLHRISLTGDTVLIITRPESPAPLGAVERDSIARYARLLEQELRLTVSSDMMPRTAPILDWIAVDDAGYLWIGLAGSEHEPTQADVFEPAGRYLGRVTLPFTTLPSLPPRFRDGRLYTVGSDELGTPSLLRAHIAGRP